MSRSRMPLVLGLGAAGGIGYYLYSAGGNAKAAEKKFESDAHRASATVKDKLPGRSPNAEKEFKGYGQEAGAKIDKAWAEADREAGKLKSNAEAYAKDAKSEALRAVDKFDHKVEDGAAKAKSGISGWFGGSSSK
ncbi:calcofluor white hypersensitive [Trichoderma arundinaceum]|uniref:Calcofluor white hypersensitive n=1 Tax=Trichoderma arundinaceum TaxID=490622 RepID=A0A395NUJ3_TRIAR|nr:calcofluor white hypersensitive [Trichoderma arundinaceum]